MTKKHIGETSYKETAFGILPRSQLIPLEIEGIKRAWDFVLMQNRKGKIPITTTFLKKTHQIGFGWIFPETRGKFRIIEVTVSKHSPPKAFHVPQLMRNFVADLKIRLKHLPDLKSDISLETLTDLLAWAHHQFLWIHPFTDYNGRIGRLLINMILLNMNLPPIELKVDTKAGRIRYIKALQRADEGFYDKLGQLIREAIEEAVRTFK